MRFSVSYVLVGGFLVAQWACAKDLRGDAAFTPSMYESGEVMEQIMQTKFVSTITVCRLGNTDFG
jgi:hypothetical protein